MVEPELGHRSVYRFDRASGELAGMADFEQSNGLAFAPDGRMPCVSDTSPSLDKIVGDRTGTAHRIEAFDVGMDGCLPGRRLFRRTDHGHPDGSAVDQRGWVWTTAADGTHIVAPDRTRLGSILTPVNASNCASGGVHGRRLFIAGQEIGGLARIRLVEGADRGAPFKLTLAPIADWS